MADNSKIEWTGATWNPWHGCIKVSPGCKFCYMYRDKKRYGQDPTKVLRSKTLFSAPLAWQDGRMVFTCSWSDWFIEEADAWRDEAWDVIRRTPQHTYQILTKRAERVPDHLPADWGDGWPNVWLGFSAENQQTFDERWRAFRTVPAFVKWASLEPLLGPVEVGRALGPQRMFFGPGGIAIERGLDWIVVGGESGAKDEARPFNVDWARDVLEESRGRCAVFVKQMGTNPFVTGRAIGFDGLRLKDWKGGAMQEWPEDLRVREFPNGAK